jgi:uncharacterized membrane protein YfcA
MISFIIMVVFIFITAIRNYLRAKTYSLRILMASVVCGLTTYLLHGFLNNFLDMDKAAVPFWGFTAIVVAVDVYYLNGKKNKSGAEEDSKGEIAIN